MGQVRQDYQKNEEWQIHTKLGSGSLAIHQALFEAGMVVVKVAKPADSSNKYPVTPQSFRIKDRTIVVNQLENKQDSTKTERPSLLSSDLNKVAAPEPARLEINRYAKRPLVLAEKLTAHANNKHPAYPMRIGNLALTDERHRNEVFLSLINETPKGPNGSYVYLWTGKNDDALKFTGIKTYVLAGCIFGASLQGSDGYWITSLIKHDISFPGPKQKIIDIVFDFAKVNAYEEMLFIELKRNIDLMKSFAETDRPEVLYHLPYYDYVLFGVELFIRGRIKLSALGELIDDIYQKKDEHTKKIKAICDKHNIKVRIESPFLNLFGPLGDINYTDLNAVARDVLKKLGVSELEVKPELINPASQKENEANLVQSCLQHLQHNSRGAAFPYDETFADVWRDLIKITGAANIVNIEGLFKIANAVMIGVAALKSPNYAVSSLLPLSEKQIDVAWDASIRYARRVEEYLSLLEKISIHQSKLARLETDPNNRQATTLTKELKRFEEELAAHLQELKKNPTFQEGPDNIANLKEIAGLFKKYGSVLFMTTMDHFVTYDQPLFEEVADDNANEPASKEHAAVPQNRNIGLPFYSMMSPETLYDLLKTKQVLKEAHKNIGQQSTPACLMKKASPAKTNGLFAPTTSEPIAIATRCPRSIEAVLNTGSEALPGSSPPNLAKQLR